MPAARLRAVGIESLVSLGDLASAEIDLHIGLAGKGPGLHAAPLFKESTALVARKGHPALGARLAPRALGALRHVSVEMVPGRGFRDPVALAYARAGIPRDVAMTVPTFTAAAAVVAATDWVATLPASLLAVLGIQFGLRALKATAPPHTIAIALCWHERTHADPAMIALREIVRRALISPRPG
jgi:DNA-binding transcriptional LysR family regulator